MRVLVADDTLIWLANCASASALADRSVEDNEDVAIDFKKFTNAIRQAAIPFVVAVSRGCASIRIAERRARFRAKARGIVAHEFLAPRSHTASR